MDLLKDSHIAVIHSFFAMASSTLVVAIVAIVKEMVVAKNFGASDELDAFLFSFSVVYFLPVLLTATLQGTFIPAFCETLKLDVQRGWALAGITLSMLAVGLAICMIGISLGGNLIISLMAPGFKEPRHTLALSLLWTLLPAVVLAGINEQLKNTLNALKVFAIPSFSQIVPSFFTIGAILLAQEEWGIYAFAIGWDAGLLAQTIILIWCLKGQGGSYSPRVDLYLPEFVKLIRQSLPYLIVPLSTLGILFVDRYFASILGSGVISYFNYAEKLFRVPWMIIAAALFTTALPFFSEQLNRGTPELKEGISLTIRLAAFLTIPIAVGMSILGQPVVSVLFERGAFGAIDTDHTATVLLGFMASLFFYAVTFILDRGLCVLGSMRVLMNLAIATFLLKVLLAWGMTKLWGLAGLALSTVPVLVFQAVCMYLAIRWRIGGLELPKLLISLGKTLLASASMAILVQAIWGQGSFGWPQTTPRFSSTVTLAVAVTVGTAFYWLLSLWMKSTEAAVLLKIFGNRSELKGFK